MRERSVSDREVEEVLGSFEKEEPAKKGRFNRYKIVGSRRIRVTFEHRSGGRYFVWTVTADEVTC
jgi:hypothetical protein